jgi:elongation factor Ts
VIRLSSETDFVAKNDDFVNFAKELAQIALDKFPADLASLLSLPYDNVTIGEKVIEQVGVIGEKIELADYQLLEADQVVSYTHMGNKAGVILGLNNTDPKFKDAGRDVAMQVVAMKPVALDKNGVDSSIVEKEVEIGKEVARKAGKPEEMLEKIAMGKLNKFFKENTLLPQAFVKDTSKSVDQYLRSMDSDLTVTGFKHVKLG